MSQLKNTTCKYVYVYLLLLLRNRTFLLHFDLELIRLAMRKKVNNALKADFCERKIAVETHNLSENPNIGFSYKNACNSSREYRRK